MPRTETKFGRTGMLGINKIEKRTPIKLRNRLEKQP
jgi:hypothetical protein